MAVRRKKKRFSVKIFIKCLISVAKNRVANQTRANQMRANQTARKSNGAQINAQIKRRANQTAR
jgi:hypothetical protein